MQYVGGLEMLTSLIAVMKGTGEGTGLTLIRLLAIVIVGRGSVGQLTCEQGIPQAIRSKAHSMAKVTEGCTAPIIGQEHIVSCQATPGKKRNR